jgi:hypothetical protein
MYWEQEKEKKTKQTINYKFIDLNLKNMSFPSGSELMTKWVWINEVTALYCNANQLDIYQSEI